MMINMAAVGLAGATQHLLTRRKKIAPALAGGLISPPLQM